MPVAKSGITPRDNFMVDGIQSVAIHNGVARVLFMRLDTDGEPLPSVELNIPMNQVASITTALSKVK